MFFNFTFRQYLTNPHRLADDLQTSTIRGFRKRIVFVFLAGLLLFGARSWWGMGTESLTPLVATMTTADFTLARFASFFGTLLWSIIYLSFHFFGFAYILIVCQKSLLKNYFHYRSFNQFVINGKSTGFSRIRMKRRYN